MTRARLAIAALALMALTQCGSKPKTPTGFDVELTVTPAAAEALKAAGKKVVVDAYYYGAPVEASAAKVNDDGQINLGEDWVTAEAAGKVAFSGGGIDMKLVDKTVIKDGAAMVHVSAYSETTAPNLLSCSTFDGAIAEAQKAKVAIACDVKT